MTRSSANNADHELSFEELKKLIPIREKDLIHWNKQRVNGIYITAIGIGIALGTWMLTVGLSEKSGVSYPAIQMPLFSILAMIFGGLVTVFGVTLWSKNRRIIHKSYRDFDRAMIAVLQHANDKKKPRN